MTTYGYQFAQNAYSGATAVQNNDTVNVHKLVVNYDYTVDFHVGKP